MLLLYFSLQNMFLTANVFMADTSYDEQESQEKIGVNAIF